MCFLKKLCKKYGYIKFCRNKPNSCLIFKLYSLFKHSNVSVEDEKVFIQVVGTINMFKHDQRALYEVIE